MRVAVDIKVTCDLLSHIRPHPRGRQGNQETGQNLLHCYRKKVFKLLCSMK